MSAALPEFVERLSGKAIVTCKVIRWPKSRDAGLRTEFELLLDDGTTIRFDNGESCLGVRLWLKEPGEVQVKELAT